MGSSGRHGGPATVGASRHARSSTDSGQTARTLGTTGTRGTAPGTPGTRSSSRAFSSRILIGLAAGIVVGLFIGERATALKWVRVPLAYAIAKRDKEFQSFINSWVELKRKDGTVEQLYQYWVLGRDAEPTKPRWSIMRNVLHWAQ